MTSDTITIYVEPGKWLPQPGDDITTSSDMTGLWYVTHVTRIKRLNWRETMGGEPVLVVTVSGSKRRIPTPPTEPV